MATLTATSGRLPPPLRRLLALAALHACASAPAPGRAALALGRTTDDDAAIRAAERTLAEGDLPRARELWSALAYEHPADATGRYATLRLARLDLAAPGPAAAATARARLAPLPPEPDAALALRRALVEALVAAREGRPDDARARSLATLRGRYVDATDVVEADCAEAELATDAAPALAAFARVEGSVEGGVRWVATGLTCDDAAARTARFQALLPAVGEPGEIAAVLDALPAGHAWRVALARRLRAVAQARGEERLWTSHLADLPDTEAAILPAVRPAAEAVLRIGVLAPLSGAVANVGADVVRSAQQAVEGVSRIELMLEDESRALPHRSAVGDGAVTPMGDLVRSLRERGAVAIVGPALDANVAAAVAAAQAQGVPLWLPTPADATAGEAHAVGPSLRQRADAIAAAVRPGARVALHLPTLPPDPPLDAALRAAFARRGAVVVRGAEPSAHQVLAGFFDEESLRRWTAAATRSTARWLLDARAATAGTPGRWVGLAAADGYGAYVATSCSRSDGPPSEIAALYYDAVIAAVGSQRVLPTPPALRRDALVSDDVASARACAPVAASLR